MNWGEEDGKREIVLRKCLRESMLVDIKKVRLLRRKWVSARQILAAAW